MNTTASTIFVVDDELSVRKSLGRLLRAAGYHVETFASAREFLERPPDGGLGCLVLDIQMPDLNGLELQQALAAADLCLPIIFITGHGDIPTSVRAMKAGATDFLSKPFDEMDLLDAIARALEAAKRELATRAETAEAVRRLATLTPREREVLLQVLTGHLNKQIAATLGASKLANLAAGTVTPGQQITVSFDWKGADANGGVVDVVLFSEVSGGGISKTDSILGGGGFPANWTKVGPLNLTAGADVSGGVTLQITAICGGVAGCVSNVFIDNVSIVIN